MNELEMIEKLLNEMEENVYSNDVANEYIRIKVGKELFERLRVNNWLYFGLNPYYPILHGITVKLDRYLPPYEIQIDNVRTGDHIKKDLSCIDNIVPIRIPLVENYKLPKKYIVNKDACVLFWSDNNRDKTVVRRAKDDAVDPVKAFLWAYFEHNCGLSKTQANKYLEKVEKEMKL